MSKALKVVAFSAGTARPSKTLALTETLLAQLGEQLNISSSVIELSEIGRALGASLYRSEAPSEVEAALAAVESADLLIVATPVYRGSYTGHFKHFFDLIEQDALIDTPVLLAATGGSDRHALILDHQLRPLFSFLQALTLPIGVYASAADFDGYQITSHTLNNRIDLAVERAARWFGAAYSKRKTA